MAGMKGDNLRSDLLVHGEELGEQILFGAEAVAGEDGAGEIVWAPGWPRFLPTKMPPPLGEYCFGIPAGVQHR